MKAQLFFLTGQERLRDEIASLLREHIYRDLQVDLQAIGDNYSKASTDEEHRVFKSYLYLLKASMVKVGDFKIIVADSEGNWVYVYLEEKSEQYLRLAQSSLTSVFPAVAIMDRMVLVPQGIHSAFDYSSEFSFLTKPLDQQGVLLVDFQDSKAIREGIQKVGVQLKAEIAQLCRQHMFVNKILHPDLDDLARLLKIDKRFLEQYRDQIFVSSVKLIPRIVSGPVLLEKRSRVVLEIHNESEEALERVRVQVRAPAGTLMKASVAEYLDFSVGKANTQKIQFEVFPHARPYCPLEVMFMLDEASQKYVSFPIPVILSVV